MERYKPEGQILSWTGGVLRNATVGAWTGMTSLSGSRGLGRFGVLVVGQRALGAS